MLLQKFRQLGCGNGCNLREDGLLGAAANGAASVLANRRTLVSDRHASSFHEDVPGRNAQLAKALHHVFGEIEGQAPVTIATGGLDGLLHHLHEDGHAHLGKVRSVGPHQGACDVGEAEAHGLLGHEAVVRLTLRVAVFALPLLFAALLRLGRLVLAHAHAAEELHQDLHEPNDVLLAEHALACLADHARGAHGLRLERGEGPLIEVVARRRLGHEADGRLEEGADQIMDGLGVALAGFGRVPRVLRKDLPSSEGPLSHFLRERELEQWQEVLARGRQELGKVIFQGRDQGGHQGERLLHLLEDGGLEAQDLLAHHEQAHVLLVVIVVVVGQALGVHLLWSLRQHGEDAGEKRGDIRLEVALQGRGYSARRLVDVLTCGVVWSKPSLRELNHGVHHLVRIIDKGVLANSIADQGHALKGLAAKHLLVLTCGLRDDLLQHRHDFAVVGHEELLRHLADHGDAGQALLLHRARLPLLEAGEELVHQLVEIRLEHIPVKLLTEAHERGGSIGRHSDI
mmetsp:Transcript_27177/g.69012  ORF Transcript_27177/g.69012 Transcript_27177/m.69012 type:complete len:514 (-) Transcript_27177:1559-3100(-)